ncbi:MAG: CvpA family protein [Candidatus Omnitrophica bacterium]|nr:CvpA family protein [Candidatus Omnitrophota bacterium]
MIRITYVAFQDGLSHEIFPLIGTSLTAAISLQYYKDLASLIGDTLGVPVSILDLLAFLLLIVGVGLVFKLIRMLVDIIAQVTWHPFVEKFGGLILGVLRGSVVVSILLIIFSLSPVPYFKHSIKERSISGAFFLKIVPAIHSRVSWMLPVIKIKG